MQYRRRGDQGHLWPMLPPTSYFGLTPASSHYFETESVYCTQRKRDHTCVIRGVTVVDGVDLSHQLLVHPARSSPLRWRTSARGCGGAAIHLSSTTGICGSLTEMPDMTLTTRVSFCTGLGFEIWGLVRPDDLSAVVEEHEACAAHFRTTDGEHSHRRGAQPHARRTITRRGHFPREHAAGRAGVVVVETELRNMSWCDGGRRRQYCHDHVTHWQRRQQRQRWSPDDGHISWRRDRRCLRHRRRWNRWPAPGCRVT
jgi:hypothetical protein